MKIVDAVQAVATNLNAEQKVDKAVSFNPLLLIVIEEIIRYFVDMLLNKCLKNPVQATATANNPNFLERFVMRRYIKRVLDDDTFHDAIGVQLQNAFFSSAKSVNVDQMTSLYADYKSKVVF